MAIVKALGTVGNAVVVFVKNPTVQKVTKEIILIGIPFVLDRLFNRGRSNHASSSSEKPNRPKRDSP